MLRAGRRRKREEQTIMSSYIGVQADENEITKIRFSSAHLLHSLELLKTLRMIMSLKSITRKHNTPHLRPRHLYTDHVTRQVRLGVYIFRI